MRITTMGAVSAVALSIALAGGQVQAQTSGNTMRIDQAGDRGVASEPQTVGTPVGDADTAAIADGELTQQVDGDNRMELDVLGALPNLRIVQTGQENVFEGNLRTRNDAVASLNLEYDGNRNTHTLENFYTIRAGTAYQGAAPSYKVRVSGSDNTIEDNFLATNVEYDGVVTGSENTIFVGPKANTALGGKTTLLLDYQVDGDLNAVSLRFNSTGGGAAPFRTNDIDLTVTGNENVIDYTAQAPVSSGTTTFEGDYKGDNIISTVTQLGGGNTTDVTLTKNGGGVFNHSVDQNGSASTAVMTITALGAGDFSLTQDSTVGAQFAGTMTVAVNGTVVASQ